MWNYMFEVTSDWSENCGEQFFVQCDTREEADEILSDYFWGDRVEYRGRYTDEEAEMMGLDTY